MGDSFTEERVIFLDELVSQHDASTEDWCEIVHPLTPEQKERHREISSRMSMVERLEAMTELNRRILVLRGIDPEASREMTVQLVRRDGTVVRQISPKPA